METQVFEKAKQIKKDVQDVNLAAELLTGVFVNADQKLLLLFGEEIGNFNAAVLSKKEQLIAELDSVFAAL